MADIFSLQRLNIARTDGRFVLAPVDIPTLSSAIELRIARPTSLSPKTFGAAERIKAAIIIEIDGVEYRCDGQATGGILLNRFGSEQAEYVLRYGLPCGFFEEKAGFPKRLGETSKATYRARVEIVSVSGRIDTEIKVIGFEAPAPRVAFHSSVAFDTATDGFESSGDGVITITHSATGSNLAAWVGSGNTDGTAQNGATTYDGVAMTELYDSLAHSNTYAHAGYSLAGIPSGSVSVVNTLGSGVDLHHVGVITMTGVDQTTPVGTAVATSGDNTTASVTVTSVGADDLLCSNMFSGWQGADPGADELERYEEIMDIGVFFTGAGNTQLGSAGGVMSFTRTAAGWENKFVIGAVAFKPSAAGAAQVYQPDTGWVSVLLN